MIPVLIVLAGCGSAPGPVKPFAYQLPSKYATTAEGNRTLVVYNRMVPGSQALAEYYAVKRGLPPENIVRTATLAEESISLVEVDKNLCGELKAKIASLKTIKRRIDYIVLCKGTALRSWQGKDAFGIDSYIAGMNLPVSEATKDASRPQFQNPYYGKDEPFDSDKFGIYLVTRLDGYSFEDARKLVDNSLAAKASKGPFLLDSDPGRRSGGYKPLEDSLAEANAGLKKGGFKVDFDETKSFLSGSSLAGYASWGSNDQGFSQSTYASVKFIPGAIAETFVSTSARTFAPGTTGGQSLIGDLIKNGVTGIKGYVNEPYAMALARPHLLFDRYTKGRNLAESFYAASPLIKWRDLVVGDPLCRPYGK